MSRIFLYPGLTAAALLACSGQRLAIALVHPEKVVTPRIVSPLERRLDRSARHPGAIQQIERYSHYRPLHVGVPRLSARISEWKIREHKAGYTALLNHVTRGTHDCRGNSTRLQMPCDQTHGLMANRSKRGEKHRVNAILAAPLKNLGAVAQRRPFLAVIGRHSVEAG